MVEPQWRSALENSWLWSLIVGAFCYLGAMIFLIEVLFAEEERRKEKA